MVSEAVLAKLETLPASPGVYVFLGARGTVLYVGKARSLRSRVRSYFQPGSSDVRAFVARLADELADLETFVVETEKEAALLENQLIKERQPKYNVKLRDDKEYLSLRLDPKAEWPRLHVVRRPKQDGAMYFGPYDSATAARQTLRLVNRHFQLRTCTDAELRGRQRPCLQYQIRRCPAPCVMDVDPAAYGEQVKNVGLFLSGRHGELVRGLSAKMRDASAAMAYEQAAVYRDQLRAVERVHEEQHVATHRDVDQDVVGLYRQADRAEVAVLVVRDGRLVGVRTYGLRDVALPDDELVASFVRAFYESGALPPDEVLLPTDVEAALGLADLLGERRGQKVAVLVPKRGSRTKLLRIAAQNAEHAFREKRRAEEDVEARLEDLAARLRLPKLPRRIECIDVSHTGGEDTVAVIVALRDGAPDRARYRTFRIRRAKAGDDYAAMHEALARRLRRGRNDEAEWTLPDLLVVDGGKGQLRVALEALATLGVVDLPVVALAKEKESVTGEKLVDRIYVPGQKNAVAVRSAPALAMLVLARDEAHRASNERRERIGKKRRLKSALDDVPGVGPATRAKLLAKLGSVKGIAAADDATLARAGATRAQIEALRRVLGDPGGVVTEEGTTSAEDAAVDHAFE